MKNLWTVNWKSGRFLFKICIIELCQKIFKTKISLFPVPLTKIQEFKIKKILNEQEGFLLRIGVEQSVISTCNCLCGN